jgi:hypothetical protein
MQESHRFHQYGAGPVGSTFHLVSAEQSIDIQPWTPFGGELEILCALLFPIGFGVAYYCWSLPPRCHLLIHRASPFTAYGDKSHARREAEN